MKPDERLIEMLADTAFDVPIRQYVAHGVFKLLAANPELLNDTIKTTGADPVRLRALLNGLRNQSDVEALHVIHAPDMAALSRACTLSLIQPLNLEGVIDIPEDVSIEERTKIIAQASSVVALHNLFEGNKFHAAEFGAWLQRNFATLKNIRRACLSRDHARKAFKDSSTVRRHRSKIGRNDPCPCGSGRKFKKCCDQKAESDSDLPHVSLEKEDETP